MKVIYTCYGGAHSSPVAAAIHLGRLRPDRPPTPAELMALDLYDKTAARDYGRLAFLGRDEDGNEVYVLGRGPGGTAVERALRSGLELAGQGGMPVRLVDTLPCVNAWMRVGGFLSRALGLVALGRPLVIYGTRLAFPRLVELVSRVRRELSTAGASTRPDGAGEPVGGERLGERGSPRQEQSAGLPN